MSCQSIFHVFVIHNWLQILSPFFRKIVGCTLRYNGHTSVKICGWQMCHWDKLCREAWSTSHLFAMLNTCAQNTQWIHRIHSTVSAVWWYFTWWAYQTVKLVLSTLLVLLYSHKLERILFYTSKKWHSVSFAGVQQHETWNDTFFR